MADDRTAAEQADVCRQIREAVSAILSQNGEMVTRQVLIVETMDGDGDRGCWVATDNGTPWDTLGLLDWAATSERAAIAKALGDE